MRRLFVTAVIASLLGTAMSAKLLAAEYSDEERFAAAYALVAASDGEDLSEKMTNTMVENQLQQNPALIPYRRVYTEFLQEVVGHETLREEIAELYLDYYTVEEMRTLTAFYKSPTGKKMLQVTPELTGQLMQVVQFRIQENLPRLQELIRVEAERLAMKQE
ncbi:hypothetical protein AUP74_00959 [Microbulbifer aggregans]|uniref:DUF2059 domain-containing protein n=1 Tax=Microbulbifer aggregans TaxID=1769779 RepID=A0A1C9W5J4_9GAMM|nr:DUF2059 domain-containing protein [Microbulbifer aggregans]AOS96425.1 hypothetical protein AUP74_00959 [Microbulbifer aggregans]